MYLRKSSCLFYMFFDKSYCNSFVQKKNYLYSRRNMKCLIYKRAGDFFQYCFLWKWKGIIYFSFGVWELFENFNLWTNVLWKLKKGRGKIGLEFLILYRPANFLCKAGSNHKPKNVCIINVSLLQPLMTSGLGLNIKGKQLICFHE